jgi:hypothetical protein
LHLVDFTIEIYCDARPYERQAWHFASLAKMAGWKQHAKENIIINLGVGIKNIKKHAVVEV